MQYFKFRSSVSIGDGSNGQKILHIRSQWVMGNRIVYNLLDWVGDGKVELYIYILRCTWFCEKQTEIYISKIKYGVNCIRCFQFSFINYSKCKRQTNFHAPNSFYALNHWKFWKLKVSQSRQNSAKFFWNKRNAAFGKKFKMNFTKMAILISI